MPTPSIALTDEEMDVLLALAQPIAFGRRDRISPGRCYRINGLLAARARRGLSARARTAKGLCALGHARNKRFSIGRGKEEPAISGPLHADAESGATG
jgi:hypothetical protein